MAEFMFRPNLDPLGETRGKSKRSFNKSEKRNKDWTGTALRELLTCGKSGCSDMEPGANTHCPAHNDRNPSLQLQNELNRHLDVEDGNYIFFKCFAGCSWQDVEASEKELLNENSQ